jgi:hypothetical protein
LIRAPKCDLPTLPTTEPVAVGFPTPDRVLISKSDFGAMLAYVAGLRDWIVAANDCLQAGQK